MEKLTEVWGTSCLLASTQFKEAAAERGAGLLRTKALHTCGISFSWSRGTRSCFT